MFDIGFWELALTGVFALLVLGPERLPHIAHNAGRMYGKLQRFIRNVQSELEHEVHLQQFRDLTDSASKSVKDIDDVIARTRGIPEEVSMPTLDLRTLEERDRSYREYAARSKFSIESKTAGCQAETTDTASTARESEQQAQGTS